jgi:hypothetical protein
MLVEGLCAPRPAGDHVPQVAEDNLMFVVSEEHTRAAPIRTIAEGSRERV